MTLPFSLWWLFLAILAILITASSIGSILALKYGSQNPTISNLNARINAWWVMTLVLVLAFVTGHIGSTFLFFLVSFAALRECLSLVYSRRGDYAVLVACFYVVLPVQYYFVLTDWYGMFAIFIPVYAFLLLPILAGLSGDPTRFLDRTAKIQWSLMVSVFCISHVPFLLNLKIPNFDQNILLVIFLIAVVQASDVLQYIWGKLLGKRKIAPVLSPSKTVEGFVGGVFLCRIARAVLFRAHRLVWHVCDIHTRVCLLIATDFGRLIGRPYPLPRPHCQDSMVVDGECVLYFARTVFTEFENSQFRPKHLIGDIPDCGGTSQ